MTTGLYRDSASNATLNSKEARYPCTPRAETLAGSLLDFAKPQGIDLLERTDPYNQWRSALLDDGLWQISRVLEAAPGTTTRIVDQAGRGNPGLNFASQDYLGLARHPAIIEAASRALAEFGPHSAGSPAASGNTSLSRQLERKLGEALELEHVLLFPTGWAAGFGVIAGLVRADDWIVIDQLGHSCLMWGANAATRNVRRFQHNDVADAKRILEEIRARDTEHAILLVTESLFSMDADVPDLAALQEACHAARASLLVDVAHDFGALGPGGCGAIAQQGLLGKVDLVIGACSKTLAANGGFVATRRESVTQYLRVMAPTHTFSNAISPLQTAVILAALDVVRSAEGNERRARLLRNSTALRTQLADEGIRCLGVPSAVVPAIIGDEGEGRVVCSLLMQRGVFSGFAEYPGVALGKARLRLQVSAAHTDEQVGQAAKAIGEAAREARGRVGAAKAAAPAVPRVRLSGSTPEFAPGSIAVAGIGAEDAARLAAVARVRTVENELVILREGVRSPGIAFIQSGTVRIETEHMGARIEIASLGPGDLLGEVSMLDGRGATASAVAVGPVRLVELDETGLRALAKSDPGLAFRLMRAIASVLAGRLRGMSPAYAGMLAERNGL